MSEDIKLKSAPIKLQDKQVDQEVTPEDIQALEARIEEVERYLGI